MNRWLVGSHGLLSLVCVVHGFAGCDSSPSNPVGVGGSLATGGTATAGGNTSLGGAAATGGGSALGGTSSTQTTSTTPLFAKSLSAGSDFVCSTLSDGTARCWGSGYKGELGDGNGVNNQTPAKV